MDTGIDYAGAYPGAAAIKAAGFKFVARYLSRYSSKTITLAEAKDLATNELGLVLVFEDSSTNALGGYNQGVADAKFALAEADSIGFPSNRPIFLAVDFDISDAQKPTAGAYLKGAASVLGLERVGTYGGYWWVKYAFDNGLTTFGWQAVAWSGGLREARAHIFQQLGGTTVNGTACDIDQALQSDYGQANIGGIMHPTYQQVLDAFNTYGIGVLTEDQQNYYVANTIDVLWSDLLQFNTDRLNEQKSTVIALQAQVATMQAQITALENKPDESAQVKELTDEVNKLTSQNKVLQDQINSANKTGNAFITWIGNFFNRSRSKS